MAKTKFPRTRKNIIAIAIGLAVALLLSASAIFLLQQSYRLSSRTIDERNFSIGGERWQTDLATIRDFENRHGLKPEANGGLRLAIDEWPAWEYLISIETSVDGSAKGAIYAVAYDSTGPVYEENFSLDKDEARFFFDSFDQKIDGYWGPTRTCTDGTSFAFERWNHKAVLSGSGNAACQHYYAELMSLVAETLIVPLKKVPFDWRSWFWAKRFLELHDKGS